MSRHAFEFQQLSEDRPDVEKQRIRMHGRVLTFQDVVRLWQQEPAFREHFQAQLADCRFAAYFFETPPVRSACFARPFEYVTVDSPALSGVTAESEVFARHFQTPGEFETIRVFLNLGGDATLIVPRPGHEEYAHLAEYVRRASPAEYHEYWQAAGQALERAVSSRSQRWTWLNTSGLGVFWLHLRLDTTPKYYTYSPYRTPDS